MCHCVFDICILLYVRDCSRICIVTHQCLYCMQFIFCLYLNGKIKGKSNNTVQSNLAYISVETYFSFIRDSTKRSRHVDRSAFFERTHAFPLIHRRLILSLRPSRSTLWGAKNCTLFPSFASSLRTLYFLSFFFFLFLSTLEEAALFYYSLQTESEDNNQNERHWPGLRIDRFC